MPTNILSRRVLVADDDPVTRHLVSSLIEREGYLPVVVEDGRAAYQLLSSDADFCGAIFDMNMPYIEGMDVIRFMRTEKRLMRIPALMITARTDLRTMANSFTAGAILFLPKPFSNEQFQSTFRLLMDSHVAGMQSIPAQSSVTDFPNTHDPAS